MVKRKLQDPSEASILRRESKVEADSSDEDGADGIVNCDFEWFDPQAAHDFHGIKALLQQLLDYDAELLDLSGLTDLILSQPLLGSTIKTEGNDSDPFAILSIINLKQHRAHSAVLPLISYLLEQLPPHSDIKGLLTEMLASGSKTEIGLILSARVMNLPVQTMPPTYSMLLEEIKWAVDDDEQYRFSHYLLLSKVYTEVTSTLDQMNQQHVKRKKKSASKEPEIFYFHAEDEILAKYAIAKASFAFRNHPGSGASDSRRAFQEEGIDPQGFLLLFEADRFSTAIQALSSASDSSE